MTTQSSADIPRSARSSFTIGAQPSLGNLTESNVARWPPSVWLIKSYRAGENSQILALGEALGWPYEIKDLQYRPTGFAVNLMRRVSLAGIVRNQSSPLHPPWPHLIISAGLRNEPVCRWIRQQSGGKTRLVHLGRPWARLEHFDLIITTPQYRLPNRPNVLHNVLTLHRITESRLLEAATLWSSRLAHLPKPYIAVMIGGNSGPYTFGSKAAARLARQASSLANAMRGSLLVSTSARTPRSAVSSLRTAINSPSEIFEWTPNAANNPYYGFLALAESIIVTNDSIAMLSEACATNKPVYIFSLAGHATEHKAVTNQPRDPQLSLKQSGDFRPSSFLYQLLMRIGPERLTRDPHLIYDNLINSRRAVWLGQEFPKGQSPPPLADLEQAVSRVAALLTDV